MNNAPIRIWPFYQAPEELRDLSPHGGDEDWLAIVDGKWFQTNAMPIWMDTGTAFGCSSVSEHELPNGDRVFIGAHA